MTSPQILDLEHDGNEYLPAIAPLGQDPAHCSRCRLVDAQRRCPHPDITEVDITTFADATQRTLRHCTACGKLDP